MQGGLTVALLVLIPLLAVAGSDDLRATFDFTTGVLSLVSLTATVAWGLLATDRLFLSTRQRLLAQGIHRATAVASLGFLLLHVTVKVALGHVALIGALIPFGLGVRGTAGLIGFGSLAGLLMIVAAATGALRSAFAHPSPATGLLGNSLRSPLSGGRFASRWRALHGLAYPAWCSALIHGLYAGRAAATWVVVMYGLCLLAVAAALCLRLLPPPAKRRIAARITALISPDTLPAEPDPDVRSAPLPGTGRAPSPDAPGRFEPMWNDPDREVRGVPVRPRTLPAPSPPLYEAPPRSSERLGGGPPAAEAPLKGPGIAAAYRAVSLSAEPPPAQPGGRWPTPSPAPPTQAARPPQDPGHAYAPAQEGPYDAFPHTAPPYSATPHTASPQGTSPYSATGDTARLAGPLPGPLYPPPAGEPWHAPAGDRP
ncbi:hypothetical protein ACFT7S_21285 [Streptomyces sp. NPDC057136]|uniref:hypothetical protein n=1 Tax=Streptomyces sp. NPDC057136 TaxID=3346029 RepID=UPI003639AF82